MPPLVIACSFRDNQANQGPALNFFEERERMFMI